MTDPYRTGNPSHAFDPDSLRVPYDGQTRMRLMIASGLARARIVIDPAARDLLAIECGEATPPRIRFAGGEIALSWRRLFGEWMSDLFAAGRDDVAIVLHPAVEWTVAVRHGLCDSALDLAAGKVERIDIGGGCSDVLVDLPQPMAVVPIRIAGGASNIRILRPADAGISLDAVGGLSTLHLDDRALDAIGSLECFASGDVTRGAPHYQLTVAGGTSNLSIERR